MSTRVRMRQTFEERYPGLNPATYAALVAWWEQNDARGYGTAALWPDLSGHGNDLVQATAANQPSIVGTVGGVAGRIRSSDGTDDFLTQRDLASVTLTAAASGSNGIQVADSVHLDQGTGAFTLSCKRNLASYIVAAILMEKHDGTTGYRLSTVVTTGYLKLEINDTTYTSNAAPAITGNTEHEFTVTASPGVTNTTVTFYCDGIIVGTAQTATNETTTDNAVSFYAMGTDAIRTAGIDKGNIVYNRALTAAQVLSLYTTGEVDPSDKWGAFNVYVSDFSAGVDGWTGIRMTAAGNIDGIGGQDNNLRGTLSGGANSHVLNKVVSSTRFTDTASTARLRLYIYIPSANAAVDGFAISRGTNWLTGYSYTESGSGCATDVWIEVDVDNSLFNGALTVYVLGGTNYNTVNADGDLIYVRAVIVDQKGATLALEPIGIRSDAWYDSSTNALDASYPAAGCTPTPDPAPNFNLTGSFTYWEWLKPSDGQPAADQVLFAKGEYATPNYGYSLKLKTTGKLEAIVSSNGTTATGKITDSAIYADGVQTSFNMVAVAYDASAQTVTFYNNGSPVASSNLGGGGPPASIKDVYRKFTLGASSVPLLYYAGSKGGGGLMSRALSAAETQRIFLIDAPTYGLL